VDCIIQRLDGEYVWKPHYCQYTRGSSHPLYVLGLELVVLKFHEAGRSQQVILYSDLKLKKWSHISSQI